MKKPVILIVGIIYILSIVIVGFLGIKPKVFNEKIYVEDIVLTFDEKLTKKETTNPDIDYFYTVKNVENLTFDITAQVTPNNATNKECTFESVGKDDYYTLTSVYAGEATIATIQCSGSNLGRTISLKVSSTDGNKSMVKFVDILLWLK